MARTENTTALQPEIPTSEVTKRIYTLRGFQVMLDRDLAELYKVETKVLKRAVKANIARFPQDDFMFEVQQHELEFLRCKFCTSNVDNSTKAGETPYSRSQFYTSNREHCTNNKVASSSRCKFCTSNNSTRGGTRYAPFAFGELGVAMLSSVLHSSTAIQVNIGIMRLFVQLRNESRGAHPALVPESTETLADVMTLLKQRFDKLETQLQNPTPASQALTKHQPMSVIQIAVARHFGLTDDDLKSSSRTQAISLPRQIAIYLARKNLGMGFTEIGKHFGGRDHSTVLHGYRKILADIETNTMIRMAVDTLGNEIGKMLT